jgi:hypothetical protein
MRRLLTTLAAAAALCAATALPAQAKETITEFEVTPSTTQSGGHPDFETRFELGNHGTGTPGEAAQDVSVRLPEGLFGNPNAVAKCASDDFALAQCPTDAQVGVIVVRANYGGDDQNLLGTAPIYNMDARSKDETARFAFIAPVANIPINIPIRVRTEDDYGLTMTVTGIPQIMPRRRQPNTTTNASSRARSATPPAAPANRVEGARRTAARIYMPRRWGSSR